MAFEDVTDLNGDINSREATAGEPVVVDDVIAWTKNGVVQSSKTIPAGATNGVVEMVMIHVKYTP